jgi:hypothetical protein
MFKISDYYKMDMSWDDAVALITGCGCGDLLKGLENMNIIWEDVLDDYMTVDDFYDQYIYEVNAFNIVYEGMSKLFIKEAA